MKDTKEIIQAADREYINSVFDALMNFQIIEELLKDCILASYEILAKTCPAGLDYNPSKNDIKKIENNLGLGGLVGKFEMVTPYKDLCERILHSAQTRNELAHKAAANYLKFPISLGGAERVSLQAEEYRKASKSANSLYFELNRVYEEIMLIHGEKV